ncbi:MAG: N-6 DNA methylase, partial [Acidimicrobiia bacterium]|nr:N-6 DNA methylase [Acidimicrobiia bacterium]
MQHHREVTNFIWRVADILRGHYKQSEYGRVILPLTVLRRLDSVMAETRDQVAAEIERYGDQLTEVRLIGLVERTSGLGFFNRSRLDFDALVADPDNVAQNLRSYVAGFSENVRAIFQRFQFDPQISKLDRSNVLFQVVRDFANIDLHQDRIDNTQMGYLYEELIRRFSEQSNETAGEHFTPREVIRMMVAVLFEPDTDALTARQLARTVYDPACGTGGMLSVAENYATDLNPSLIFEAYGQELNPESWATCVSDMLMKGQEPDNIVFGNTFTHDGLPGERFHYMLCNPPFGVDWKAYRQEIEDEASQGLAGRFHAGTPRVSDGSLLFLQHMISKMRPPQEGGSRIAIVFNASPLFTGQAGSGESEIRRWLIESDYLEAIIGLPDQLFYNTGISTYVWILTNRKEERRRGKVQWASPRIVEGFLLISGFMLPRFGAHLRFVSPRVPVRRRPGSSSHTSC